ncbi:response regulator [Christiangramia salexigens]|uniref:Response regulator n=1 Tax=Christiangramia salexigens TaxID=1913577 RepID=A0A1L3J2Q0_9FLAO|nr:response regulator [Christiangramia salexigens]APG59398.1 response regulator [Christiangramia salexigens]
MKKIDIACIIDDDPIFIFGTKKIMKLANFCNSFMVFHNGEEAINHLKPIIESNQPSLPDVILLDLNMPIMDGWQFLDEFIKIPCDKQITIYIVSSSINPDDMERAKSYDKVSTYLIKPITPTQLQLILSNENTTKNKA